MDKLSCQVLTVDDVGLEGAIDLLSRFFNRRGFSENRSIIAANTRRMNAAPFHRVGLAWTDNTAVGVVTVTMMLYIEWGRLGEIGDPYQKCGGEGI